MGGAVGLARIYSDALRLAAWLDARRRILAWVALPGAVLTLVAVNHLALLGFPNSGDEYAYLYQASTLSAGRLWNPAPVLPESFALSYVIFDEGRAFGSFPLGWPLLLAVSMRLGVPPWLVNPLLGAMTLWLVARLGTQLYSSRIGILGAAVVGRSRAHPSSPW